MTAAPQRSWRTGLFGKYVLSFVGLTLLLLIANGGLETWFVYRENTQLLTKNLAEKAEATSRRIEEFISDVQRQISWATRASSTTMQERSADYALLLQQVPAIERLIQLDANGKEQLRLTRSGTVVGSGVDYSSNPRYTKVQTQSPWLSPVYFDGLDPYISIAMRHAGRNAGATVAEVSLKFVSTFIDSNQIGGDNSAYVVGSTGRLLARSGSTPHLGTDLRNLPQVAAAIEPGVEPTTFGKAVDGTAVLTATARVPRMSWFVFFEQPLNTALKPVYSLLFRTMWLLSFGVLLSVLFGTLMARRMVVPIRALQVGAQQLEASDFGHRIQVQTGDEIEDLADRFNRMADQLQGSYLRLEQKVAERTQDLEKSISELEALEEFDRAVVTSLDIKAVLGTIVTHAVMLTKADAGAIYSYDPTERAFELAEAHDPDSSLQHVIRIDLDESLMGLAATRGEPISIPDIASAPDYPHKDTLISAGYRSLLVVPLVGQNEILGGLILQRRVEGDFPGGTINLLQAFAHQSALAIKNSRLFREIEKKSRELSMANEHKRRFFANMSHELRTPMNSVLGFSELLYDGIYGNLPTSALDVLERIQKDGRHLLGLINDVLDLSKIEADQLNLVLEDYSLQSVVEGVVATTEPLARAKAIEVKTSMPDDLPVGHGDGRRLAQVLLNIVGNAIKFTDAGWVEIRAAAVSGHFAIAVQDTGPGIPPEDQARIFEEFQQVDSSATRNKGGTGLGLSIARRLVDIHGGHIQVQSTVGVGTTFNIVIPIRVTQQRSAA